MNSARATLSDSGPKPGSNPNAKQGSAKDDSSDSERSGDPAPKAPGKSAKGQDASAEKSKSAPVVAATDPTPVADEALMLKTGEAPASRPHSTAEPVVPVQILALAQPAAASSASVAAQVPPAPPAQSSEDDAPEPVEAANLVFQLSLDSSQPALKARIATAEENETASFLSPEDVPSNPQPQAGASDSDTKSQDQPAPQQFLPQVSPAGLDGTIASQFGFQAPLSAALQSITPKTGSVAAPTSPPIGEKGGTPDLPMASSIDRVGLTLRGAGDQIVRVEISQSGELIQVGVHTGNNDLASELRASVPDLMQRLDQQGYQSRLSTPASSMSLGAPAIASAHSTFRSGSDHDSNPKSNSDAGPQEELRQQRQRNPQRGWRELATQLQED